MYNLDDLTRYELNIIISYSSFNDVFALKLTNKYLYTTLLDINGYAFSRLVNRCYKSEDSLMFNIAMNSIVMVKNRFAEFMLIKPFNILHGLFVSSYYPGYIKELSLYFLGKPQYINKYALCGTMPAYKCIYERGIKIVKMYVIESVNAIKFTVYIPHKITIYYNYNELMELMDDTNRSINKIIRQSMTSIKINNIKYKFKRGVILKYIKKYKSPYLSTYEMDYVADEDEFSMIYRSICSIHNIFCSYYLDGPPRTTEKPKLLITIPECIPSKNGIKYRINERPNMFESIIFYNNHKAKCITYIAYSGNILDYEMIERNYKNGSTKYNRVHNSLNNGRRFMIINTNNRLTKNEYYSLRYGDRYDIHYYNKYNVAEIDPA